MLEKGWESLVRKWNRKDRSTKKGRLGEGGGQCTPTCSQAKLQEVWENLEPLDYFHVLIKERSGVQ